MLRAARRALTERGARDRLPATNAPTRAATAEQPAPPLADTGASRWRLGLVVHPLLLAAYPVVFLFAHNIREQVTTKVLFETLGLVLAAVGATMVILFVVFRDMRRAGLLTSVLVALFFGFGHVPDLVSGALADPRTRLLVAGVLLVLGAALAVRLGETRLSVTTQALNLVAALLVGFNIVPIVEYQLHELGRAPATVSPAMTADPATPTLPGTRRDIYLINLDRYANAATLEQYGFDNSEFLDELRQRGFYVASASNANYLKSALSITSTLSMRYLDTASLAEQASASDDFSPLYRLLDGPLEAQRFLKSRGYRYVHLGSWWEGTDKNSGADINLRYGELSEFTGVLYDTTALPALRQLVATDSASPQPLDERERFRQRHREHTLYTLDRLPLVAEIRGPKFVFAHLALPHGPYVFDRNGGYVTQEIERSRTREQNYIEHILYANGRIVELLDVLLAGPPESDPIIIFYSDEGPDPVRYAADLFGFQWAEATPDELREKFGILNAYHLPGANLDEAGLHPAITPVNTFRVVFNEYFGTELPLLPDRQFIFPDARHLYDAIDATERLREDE